MALKPITERTPTRARRDTQIVPFLFVVLEGARLDAGGRRVALAGIDSLRIGRSPGDAPALELPDARVSGTHARIVRDAGALVLVDAGSTNGTSVNGTPIVARGLRDGDVIGLGQTVLLYRELEADAAGGAESLEVCAGLDPAFATLDPALARRLERLARVAPSPLAILVLGETGTGKELLSRGVHARSRRPGPFVAVNCGAIPANLVESQLFGHVRGAFSGAVRDEPGLIRSAHGGTLLLDEIGDLPASSQAALLRVLQEQEVLPVGATAPAKVDVRIIAATHMPLDQLVEQGGFRRDLYARLAGYTFALPPLRERRVDLGLVVAALRAAGKLGSRGAVRLQLDAATALVRHPWPMNIRELEQCLHAATLLAEDGVITLDELALTLRAAPGLAAGRDPRARVAALLAEHRGNVSAVARALQTSRTQVHRLMARYDLAHEP